MRRKRSRKTKVPKQTETQLALRVVKYLRRKGWEVYKEVINRENHVVDIYATKDNQTWAIEVKTTFGLRVMEQAEHWRRYAHFTSIAVPRPKDPKTRIFGYKVAEAFGLGVLELTASKVISKRDPKANRRPSIPELVEEQKAYEAGNSSGDYWTPYKRTIENLRVHAIQYPGMSLELAVQQIDHHYRSQRKAFTNMLYALKENKIPGVELQWRSKKAHIYPK